MNTKMELEYIEDKLSAETLNNSLVEFREYEFKLPIADGPNSAEDFTNSETDKVEMAKQKIIEALRGMARFDTYRLQYLRRSPDE